MIRFGSVCSGIEAASVAWHPLGWQAAWLSEIELFPAAVLAHHYPDVPNLGDMRALPAKVLAGKVEAPDLLCGGTPCQAFSVAGLRRSLDDARGNLTLTFVELADAIDAVRLSRGELPAILVWENVPGVLSTADNAFGCFLGALAGEDCALEPSGGRWTDAGVVSGPSRTIAWRVLDAQYFGLAQRRKRVFLVASARDDFDPAAVLLEREGVRRDSPPSREAGQRVASSAASSVEECGLQHTVGTLCADSHPGAYSGQDAYTGRLVPHTAHSLRGEGFDASEDGTGRRTPIVSIAHAFDARQSDVLQYGNLSGPLDTDGHSIGVLAFDTRNGLAPHGSMRGDQVSASLRAKQSEPPMILSNIFVRGTNPHSADEAPTFKPTELAACLNGWDERHNPPKHLAVGFQIGPQTGGFTDLAPTLDCRAKNGPIQNQLGCGVMQSPTMQVRRLTPRECERLQGFPDDYTAIPWRGKPVADCPDGPRYRALGNSWAVPVVRWIGQRIAAALEAAP